MNIIEKFKKGKEIHIKKANKGKFTEYCGGKVTSECIAKGKNSSNPAVRKRATFADNARHFKHRNGGPVFKFYGNNIVDSDSKAYGYIKKNHKIKNAANGTKLNSLINLGSQGLNSGMQLFSGLRQIDANMEQANSQIDMQANQYLADITNRVSQQYDNHWQNLVDENTLKRALGLPVENLSPIVLRWGKQRMINNATSGVKAWKDLAKSQNEIQANNLRLLLALDTLYNFGSSLINIFANKNTQTSK